MSEHPGAPEPTDTERRLRDALSDRATRIQPSTDGLTRIEEKLMSEHDRPANRKWLYGGLSAAAVAIVLVVGLVVLDDGDDTGVIADSTSSTTDTTTTTTTTTSTTTTSEPPFQPEVDAFAVAYPSPLTSQRFESAESAAQSYAIDVLGFTELMVGEFHEGDSRSGEVPVTDREGGPETTVLVRQMEDDTWYVLASITEDITVETPTAGDAISSPFDTSGTALAFEGTVDVLVRAQDDPAVLGEGFVTGSGTPPAGPFEGSIEFAPPAAETPGIVVYRELSAEDGHVRKATSFPVRLQPE